MDQPKFYVGQSIVTETAHGVVMYSITHAEYAAGLWIYHCVLGDTDNYVHENEVLAYHDEKGWHNV